MNVPQLPVPAGIKPIGAGAAEPWNARGFIRFGLICVLALGGGLGGWAATATISGAVIAMGQLRVESNRQIIQHPDGGVVGAINVRDGDRVEAGDILLRLDDTLLRSEKSALESQLYEIIARRGRLEAVTAGRDTLVFDPELLTRAAEDPNVAKLIEGQRALFHTRRASLKNDIDILNERKLQFGDQIRGTEAEVAALETQTALIDRELTNMRKLLDQGLIEVSRVLALEREQARLNGQAGQLRSRTAQLRGQITEIDIQQNQMRTKRLEDAITESRELGFRELELKERRLALVERLARLDIRAPMAGTVIDSTVHAIKSVVRPADPLMFIVPSGAELVVDARVNPTDIDQMYVGQESVLRFSALNRRTTPEIFGEIVTLSADVITDRQTGVSYYKIEVRLRDGEIEKLEEQELVAGMPVEVFVQTGEHTPLAYLMKPITDYFSRALRES